MSSWMLPVAVAMFLTWLNAPPSSLADAARQAAFRRQLLPQSTHQLSNANLPPPRPGDLMAPPEAAPDTATAPATADKEKDKPAEPAHDEKWWNERITIARDALDHDQMTVAALQSQINALTRDWINRDDPAEKSVLEQQRNKALAEFDRMKKQVDTDNDTINQIMDEARAAGVPPGWLRGGGGLVPVV